VNLDNMGDANAMSFAPQPEQVQRFFQHFFLIEPRAPAMLSLLEGGPVRLLESRTGTAFDEARELEDDKIRTQ
jgi:hypothetical protein